MVHCEDCKWFGTHFVFQANGETYENQVCLDGWDVEPGDHYCNSFRAVPDE